MAISMDDLVKIDKENKQDTWRAWSRMEALSRGEPAGTLQELVWRAQREGRLDLGGYQNQWYSFVQDYSGFGAQDFLTLIKSIHAHFARQDSWNRTPWSDEDLAGWPYNFDRFVDAKKGDAGFFKELARDWKTLPSPYDRGLATRLAQQGALSWEDLPEDLIDHHVHVVLKKGALGYGGWKDNPWPEAMWREAMLRALKPSSTLVIKEASELFPFFEFATPEQLVQAIARMQRTTDIKFPAVEKVTEHAAKLINPLHDALAALIPEQITAPEYHDADPALHLLTCYLGACEALGQEPATDCDAQCAAFIHTYTPRWSGSNFVEFHIRLQGFLAVIPQPRLEQMFLTSPEVSLLLAGACPTPAVCEKVVEHVMTQGKTTRYDFEEHVDIALRGFGVQAFPTILTALTTHKGAPQRNLVVNALAAFPRDPVALEGLVLAMSDKSKGVRERAVQALAQGEPEAVLEAITPLIGARGKDAREAAATVLLSLPPTQQGYELAQARLKKEKTDGVKSLLERVERGEAASGGEQGGSALGSDQLEELARAISAGKSGSWREHEELGEALVDVYMRIWRESAGPYKLGYVTYEGSRHEPGTSWLEILELLGDQSTHGLEQAVSLAGALRENHYENYFGRLERIYGAQRVGEELSKLVSTGRFLRPAGFQPLSYGSGPQADGARFLITRYPEHAAEAALILLEDKSKVIRDETVSFVAENAGLFTAEMFTGLLKSRRKDARLAGAQVLGQLGDASALTALGAALEKEKTSDVVEALREAIVVLNNATFEVSAFASTKKGDLELDAALTELPRVEMPESLERILDQLSAPSWAVAGQPMSAQAFAWLLCELSRESMEHHGENLVAVCERLEQEALFALCDELLKKTRGGKHGWLLFMQGVIGSPASIEETGKHLEEFAQSQSWGWGDHGVEVMVRRNTFQAVRILDDWHHKTRKNALKGRAQQGVFRIAAQQGVSVEEVLEASISDFGFDAAGEQRFDYGAGRQILVRLGSGDEFSYHDEGADKTYKSMPKARQGDDEALVFAARSRVSRIKKELKRLRRNQTRRLEDAMATQRRWVPSSWRERYALHPVMRSFAQGMVWGVYEAKGDEFLYAVHVDASGEVVDLEDETHPLSDDSHRIGVIHPSLLTAKEREQWLARFADFEIISAFEQLQRPIHRQQDWPKHSAELAAKLEGVNSATFLGRTSRMGWELGPREDAGLINHSHRTLGPWVVTVSHDGFSPEYIDESPLYIQDFSISRDGEATTLAQLPAHVFSELVHELCKATKTGEA